MKPSLPQGTRDFGPEVVRKRQYILNIIKSEFELYGFQPLETPAMENLETLLGKYGDEGDKLIFKILNNGLDNPDKRQQAEDEFQKVLSGKNSKVITERALKYDLTIPFARYIAMNHGQLTFPFKRYQIQPVWRADRPQRGRYREFYQCDADIVGSYSLLNEVEFVNLYDGVLKKLGLENYELRINSRKILSGLAERVGQPDKFYAITTAIDKVDKIGYNGVREELINQGVENPDWIVNGFLFISKNEINNAERIRQLKILFQNNRTALDGINEIEYILNHVSDNIKHVYLDTTLARGLNYYTGVIFEAKAPPQVKIGSIGGGGRYDDLTGLFGVPNMPGVGISFGVDRIYDVLEELNLFPHTIAQGTKVLLFNLDESDHKNAYALLKKLCAQGIASELYHEPAKADKQFKYAEKKNIPYVVREINGENCVIKNIKTGEQRNLELHQLSNETFQF